MGYSDSAIARLVQRGEWIRVSAGVFRLAAVAPDWEQSLLAACLTGAPDTVVSGRAAARVHHLDGAWDEVIEVSSSRRIRLNGVSSHIRDLREADRTIRDGIPVTSVERTLMDLAALISKKDLEVALDSALRQRKTTIARLKWCVSNGRRKGVKGIGVLAGLIENRCATSESPLETRLAQILRRSSLPMPEAQFRVMDGTRVIGRFDFAYPPAKLIVEVDGYRWHSGKSAWQRDRTRDNALNRLGWTVLRFTAEDLRSPRAVIAQIREVLYPRLDSGVR